jgi:hypothetical protein
MKRLAKRLFPQWFEYRKVINDFDEYMHSQECQEKLQRKQTICRPNQFLPKLANSGRILQIIKRYLRDW